MRIVVESADDTLDRAGVTVDDVAWFVPHQANVRIIEAAANRLGIPPERTLVNIDRYGNTSRGVDPARRSPRRPTTAACSDGDLVLLSGFGAGLTWGSAVCSAGAARDDADARTADRVRHRRRREGIGRAIARRARRRGPSGSRSATRPTTTGAKETQAAVEAAGGEALAVQASTSPTPRPSTPRSARSRTRSGRSSCS